MTWLVQAPLIEMLPVRDAAKPYPLHWDEQENFFKRLPVQLANMAKIKVNCGNRAAEVCGLRWEWELDLHNFEPTAFLIPGAEPLIEGETTQVKNRHDRIVVCNDLAENVIYWLRGNHRTYVFSYADRQVARMDNTAWKRGWREADLPTTGEDLEGTHNLKYAFGRRLRAAGVPKDTRRILLGHRAGEITNHYSVPGLQDL